VMVVGSGTRFISGVSHHTRYLAQALSERADVSVILMRRLIPERLYPGRERVGAEITEATYPAGLPVLDGVDWYWFPSILRALQFQRRHEPDTVVLEWWTGAVLHTYMALAIAARMRGARILIEMHEMQDTGEAAISPARAYVQRVGRLLMNMADGFIVHSEFDRHALQEHFDVGERPVRILTMGGYSHYDVATAPPAREAPPGACNFLFFGTIRPYKGLEDLVRAFELLSDSERAASWLTVVGETWEGWHEPVRLIEASRQRDRMTLVNHYVSDEEASGWFAGADVVALPYHRSSASGPLHMTMEAGLPVVITDVGGLREAADGYQGAVLVAERDPQALRDGLRAALALRGRRHGGAPGWDTAAGVVIDLATEVRERSTRAR
jgi:glycosyltransferase involved in cell wall biosynthesis